MLLLLLLGDQPKIPIPREAVTASFEKLIEDPGVFTKINANTVFTQGIVVAFEPGVGGGPAENRETLMYVAAIDDNHVVGERPIAVKLTTSAPPYPAEEGDIVNVIGTVTEKNGLCKFYYYIETPSVFVVGKKVPYPFGNVWTSAKEKGKRCIFAAASAGTLATLSLVLKGAGDRGILMVAPSPSPVSGSQ
jgi:hypothetical protein